MIRILFQWLLATLAVGFVVVGMLGYDAALVAGSVLIAAMIIADAIQRARFT